MPEKTTEITINLAWCKCCYICIEVCPVQVYTRSDYVGEKGSAIPLATNAEKCVHCSLCELMCPDMAITVRGEKRKKSARKKQA